MIKVVVIGSGNVAQHLISAFENESSIDLVQAFARTTSSLLHLLDATKITTDFSALKDADLYIIAVSDDAIPAVSQSLALTNKLVAHTSGSVSLEDLSATNRKAVFYPLQTLSKNKAVTFKEVPLCIEAQNDADLTLLHQVASSISDKVYHINSVQRQSLHVAAVFVSNFVNHLYKLGNDICNEHQIAFEILQPLLLETAQKVQILSPDAAQTGPASRKDSTTINKHLALLTDENQKEIYKILTKSIIDHGKKL